MNFITYSQLKRDVIEWADKFVDFDAIVGIERSGVLPATILALHLNKVLLTTNDLLCGIDGYIDSKIRIGRLDRMLILDDSISSGRAMGKVREIMKGYNVQYGAVYGLASNRGMVDYLCKEIELPRVFEWNLFHNDNLRDAILDIDGVIFKEPPLEDNRAEYERYLENPIPYHIPTVEVKGLVTGRLEKYREITELTLKRYNVKYGFLIMANYETPEQRRMYDMGLMKGEIYRNQGSLFIESSSRQAEVIRRDSGKEVICIEEL